MLDAIALYLTYQSNHVISLRIVMTDLNLLFCTSRKDKTNVKDNEAAIDDSNLSKHMIYQIDWQVIEHNCTIKTSSYSTQ